MRTRRHHLPYLDGTTAGAAIEPGIVGAVEAFAGVVAACGPPGDDSLAQAVVALGDRLERLEARVLHQFGALATYAELDERRADELRAEAHHGALRLEATMFELLEQLRAELAGVQHYCDELVTALARVIDHQCVAAERITRVVLDRRGAAAVHHRSPTVGDRDDTATDERLRGTAPAES